MTTSRYKISGKINSNR